MKDTVTLKELAAIAVRRGRSAVILALICSLLLGGWRANSLISTAHSEDNSPEKIEKRYQEAVKSYEDSREDLEKQLAKAEEQLESQREYNDTSFCMKIDPYNKVVTTINLAITDIDEGAFQQVFRLEETPVDFIVSKIQSQYIILWNSLDLQTSLSYSPQADMEDKYLREIITLTRSDGGCLTLTVSGISEAETSRLAEAAYDCLIGLQSRISEGSYLHSFALLNDVTKVSVDNNLENTQTENLKKIRTYTDNIADLSKQLEELEEPKRETAPGPLKIVLSCVKYAVLGAVIGCLLALMCAMVSYLFRCRPETSRQIEEGLSIPFLGSVAKSGGFWDRMANRILSERLWADEDQALAYISASAATLLPVSECRDVLLISTLPLKAEEVGAVIKALENQNRTVRFVGGALRNPEAAEALKACGCVVLAERPGVTRWDDAIELTALSKNLERSVGGFVTV